jgi:hypothetical protein
MNKWSYTSIPVSATGWSLVQRSPTECGVSKKCVIVEARKMRRPRPPKGCRAIGGGEYLYSACMPSWRGQGKELPFCLTNKMRIHCQTFMARHIGVTWLITRGGGGKIDNASVLRPVKRRVFIFFCLYTTQIIV